MINKSEFRDTLSLIAQLKISSKNEQDEIEKIIVNVQDEEIELKLRRTNLNKIEALLFEKTDELFSLVYQHLPEENNGN